MRENEKKQKRIPYHNIAKKGSFKVAVVARAELGIISNNSSCSAILHVSRIPITAPVIALGVHYAGPRKQRVDICKMHIHTSLFG